MEIYEIHCDKCNINVTIETDVKATRKHRCRTCGRILKDGHLPEDENKKVLEQLEKRASRTDKPTVKKTVKTNSKNKITHKRTSQQSSTRRARKKK